MSLASLMIHTFDRYTVTATQDASAGTTFTYTAANTGVKCFWQPEDSTVNTSANKFKEQKRGNLFFVDATVWAALTVNDRVKVAGGNYLIEGKQDACDKGKVYKVALAEDISGNSY